MSRSQLLLSSKSKLSVSTELDQTLKRGAQSILLVHREGTDQNSLLEKGKCENQQGWRGVGEQSSVALIPTEKANPKPHMDATCYTPKKNTGLKQPWHQDIELWHVAI